MNRPITVKDLVKECLKQMDQGNGNKIVMIKNDIRYGNYNPVMEFFESEPENILTKIKTNNPEQFILLG